MSPIRRRTFFGQTSDKKLERLAWEAQGSDIIIQKLRSLAEYEGSELTIPVELLEQNCKDREMRMAAEAELNRREKRQEAGEIKGLGRRR
jgi:hypothetical protein